MAEVTIENSEDSNFLYTEDVILAPIQEEIEVVEIECCTEPTEASTNSCLEESKTYEHCYAQIFPANNETKLIPKINLEFDAGLENKEDNLEMNKHKVGRWVEKLGNQEKTCWVTTSQNSKQVFKFIHRL